MSADARLHARLGLALTTLFVTVLVLGPVGVAAVGPDQPLGAFDSQANEPPVAVFEYSPSEPAPGETVVLDASASFDADGEIETYQWDFDNDGQVDAEGGPNRRIAFPRAGEYTVRLTVVDNDSATNTTTRTIRVVGDQPPEARLSVSATEVRVGETITFDPTGSSDPDGQLVSWAFDTDGDGTFEHTFDSPTTLRTEYGEPGTYQVTLQVTDNDGMTATATATVVVESTTPSATASPATGGTEESPAGGSPAGPVDGGDGLLPGSAQLVPGGGVTIGAVLVLLVLVGGGLVLYSRSEDRSAGMGLEDSSAASVGLAVLLVLLVVGGPVFLINRRFVRPAEGSADVAIALVQLSALGLLSLLVLVSLLLQFVQHREAATSPGPVVGPLGAGEFRWLTFAFGFLASVLLTLALATLLLAGTLPLALTLAAGLVLAAIAVVPLLLAVALVSLSLG